MTTEQEKRLNTAAGKDIIYLQLLRECEELEAAFGRVMEGMNDEDRDILNRYISLCEELEYRRTALAMNMPRI